MKGSAEVRTPFEAKNTLQSKAYARFVDLLSEGPIEGFCNSQGLTVQDARLMPECQPSVTADSKLWYDPTKFDVEFTSGANTGPFIVFARVSENDPLSNEPLFTSSSGFPFSGVNNDLLQVSISATFKEVEGASNETTSSADYKDNAEVYVLTYPTNSAEQTSTAQSISKTAHGFAVDDVIYRKRTAPNTYSWELLPEGVSPFLFQTRIVTSVTSANVFVAAIYPICEEGRVRALYFKTQGSNYLTAEPIINPITQADHGFTVGTQIDYVDGEWVRADRFTQTVATVLTVYNDNTFDAQRQIFDAPKLNIPSVVATAIFFDDTPLADPITLKYNYANVKLDYRLGDEVQTPLLGFEQTETLLISQQSVDITNRTEIPGVAPVILNLPNGDWDELLITLVLPDGLYRQDMTNGDLFGLGDNYGQTGAPSSSAALPENQPPVIRITYRIIEFENGRERPSSMEYAFGANDGYVVIKGKTMSPYELTIRGSLISPGIASTGNHAYRLYFYRVSPDDSHYSHGDVARRSRVAVSSVVGIINVRMSYPFCAVVGIELDAEQFSHIPTRGYQVKLLKIPVPSNYFPRFTKRERIIRGVRYTDYRTFAEYNRTPSGDGVYDEAGNPIDQIWDGTFYDSWSDNPAWITYALATNTRYGLGEHILQANKWLFYKISRYCDELIPTSWDGVKFTSKEPRFACSCYFQTFEEAWRVLSDVASSFSGFMFYQSGTMIPVQDCPRETRFAFGPANVENGFFSYTGIHKTGRYSSAVIKFTDSTNRFRMTPVVEQDEELIGRLGWKPVERTAFGCTSKFQAQRFARKLLLSSKELTTTVKFTTGLLGSVLRPGDVIEVYDPTRSSMPFAGRITKIYQESPTNGPLVVLDRFITTEQLAADDEELFATYGLVCQLPMGVPTAEEVSSEELLTQYMAKQITSPLRISSVSKSPEGYTILALDEPLPSGVEVGYVWGLRRRDVQPQTFQVVTVEEVARHKFSVVALEYQEALYDAVDYDAAYDEPPINPDLDGWKRPYPPRNLRLEIWPKINDDGQKIYVITISWSPPAKGFARGYRVEWKRGLGDYQLLTQTHLTTAETTVVDADSYCAQVRTVGLTGVLSSAVEVCTQIGVLSADNKEIVSGLELTGQANNTIFVTSDASFDWRVNWSEATSEFQTGVPPTLAPSITDYEVVVFNLAMETIFVTSRRDTSFILTVDQNRALPSGPHREFIIGIRARTRDGSLSRQTALRVKNERPPVPNFTHEADLNGYLLLKFEAQTYADFSHFNVWMSETVDFVPADENLVYSGGSTVVSLQLTPGETMYCRVAAVDTLAGNSLDCTISDQFTIVGRRVGALTVFDFLNPSWTT